MLDRVISRFVVRDTSMQPALLPGDRLIVVRWLTPRVGDIVVFRDPQRATDFTIKRVARRFAGGDLYVLGDNPNVSRDSRIFGAVPRALVIGRVFYRYLPSTRRGRV
jgi:nickel-type superoxide dismutase maturation protease